MRYGQFSLSYLFQLTLCAAITVWFGLQAGKMLLLPTGPETLVITGSFAICLGAFSGGLIGHFGPGAVVGLLSYVPFGAIILEDWLSS